MESTTTSSKDVSFTCEPLMQLLETFKRDFVRKHDESKRPLFQIPECLESSILFYFFHEKSKPIMLQNIPWNTMFVDMIRNPDETIEFVNNKVRRHTNGFIQNLDPSTESELKNPAFHHVLMFILYMKGSWSGGNCKEGSFHNQNGEIKKIQFFEFSSIETKVENGKIYAHIYYDPHDEEYWDSDLILFSRPVKTEEEHIKRANVYLPEFTIQKTQKVENEMGNAIINMKYKQDRYGFEDSIDVERVKVDIPTNDNLYFDEPFNIEIFSGHIKILDIKVNNL